MIFWYQHNIKRNGYNGAGNGDHGAHHVFIFQFVPDAQVVINAKKNIAQCQQGYNAQPLHPGGFMNGNKEPAKYINIEADEKKHEAGGDHKKLHHPRIGAGCIFFFAPVKEKWFSRHAESLYHDRNKNSEAIDISENAQFMFGLFFGQVHHMLVNKTAQHIIYHASHAHNDQWCSIPHYFFP